MLTNSMTMALGKEWLNAWKLCFKDNVSPAPELGEGRELSYGKRPGTQEALVKCSFRSLAVFIREEWKTKTKKFLVSDLGQL